MRYATLALLIVAVAGCTAAAGDQKVSSSPDYDRGVAEAKADIAQEVVFRYGYGLMTLRQYDVETGLPQYAIAGCIVDDGIIDRAKGYNETVNAWLASGGKPRNSLKQWVDDLHDLRKWWNAQPDQPVELTYEVVADPAGKDKVALGRKNASPSLVTVTLISDNQEKPVYIQSEGNRPTLLRWGPVGSRTIVFRSENAKGTLYTLVEFRRALHLDRQYIPHAPSTQPTPER